MGLWHDLQHNVVTCSASIVNQFIVVTYIVNLKLKACN
jgi:hypothetical protein